MFDPAAPDSPRWKDLLATLDAFKTMGMDVVFVQIEAPDLTFGDPKPRINFYQRLAKEIHSRNMKLYVEHFINVPFKPNISSGSHAREGLPALKELQDDPQGRQEFLNLLEQENALIYREIKPDYLTLVDEPRITINRMLHLSISADELAGLGWGSHHASEEHGRESKHSPGRWSSHLGAGGACSQVRTTDESGLCGHSPVLFDV